MIVYIYIINYVYIIVYIMEKYLSLNPEKLNSKRVKANYILKTFFFSFHIYLKNTEKS